MSKDNSNHRTAAITVKNLSKDFILPHEQHQSVKKYFTSILKNKPHKGKYDIQHALRDISFEVKQGEFFGILGRNGSGKSTLLKILAEIYQPTKGSVTHHGKLVPFIELGVGFDPDLSGRENVYLNGAMLGFSKAEMDKKYDEIVEFAELEDFMDQKLKNYSSGMQVRLAFSVAVQAEADVLLIDEVLAVGDADFQRKCFKFFKELKKSNTTVIFVSHDMQAVREFCDSAVLLEKSRIVSQGSAENISEQYSQLFIRETETKTKTKKINARHNATGEGQVVIENVELKKSSLSHNDTELLFNVTLRAQDEYEGLVSGFSIKDASGASICGTNTETKRIRIPELKKGETCTVQWTCQNIFADGDYSLTVSAHSPDNVTIYDILREVAGFTVRRIERTPHLTFPPISVTLNNNDTTKDN